MQELPYDYQVNASAEAQGNIFLKAEDVPQLVTAACAGAGGPGDQWCPERLLVAALMDSFVVSFRTIAKTAKFEWRTINCRGIGTLDRVDKVNRFTIFQLEAALTIPGDGDADRARRLLEKAEAASVIGNSLVAETDLKIEIIEQ
jgi:organic hydroperoxide reductase OsmC/OhrA